MFVGAFHHRKKFLFSVALGCFSLMSSSAFAQCCGCQTTAATTTSNLQQYISDAHDDTRQHISDEHDDTRTHIDDEHQATRDWIRDDWWTATIAPALQDMANEISTVSMASTRSIGTFFDAQNHIQTQTALAELEAEAHRDYLPSTSLCVFGTNIRSLAATEQNAITTKDLLVEWSLDRQLGNAAVAGSQGSTQDKNSRIEKFKNTYCDPDDNDGGFRKFCGFDDGEAIDPDRVNRDIDYTRVFDSRLTLELDFDDAGITNDEEDIMALAKNLYAHDLFFRPAMDVLAVESNQDEYLDSRSIIAKRNVAENSFYSIAAMKAQGTMSDTQYLNNIIAQMGFDVTDADQLNEIIGYLGKNPSYSAQMEVLTKKLYQNPNFYINLIDNPANVDRQHAAMQSFELMQQRDIFESFLRTEMLISMLVELELDDLQDEIQNDISDLGTSGRRE